LGEGDAKLLDVVVRESDRISRIVTDFLQFADLRKPRFQKVPLGEVLEEVRVLLEGRRGQAGLRTEIDVDGADRLYVLADPEQLVQVFLNLGLNAFEAMEDAGGRLEITAAPSSGSEPRRAPDGKGASIPKVKVVFRDHGPGLAGPARANLYQPFFTTKARGSGMGLATVKRIVDAHGGAVDAANHPDGGAVFTVTLSGWVADPAETVPVASGSTGSA
jgi:signal transduction histidine kinase